MHKLASEGPKQAVQLRVRCKMAKRKRLANVDSVLGILAGVSLGRAEAAACEERECGCVCV